MAKKTGLVLEGGAMRGMYTAGVLDVLMENDIRFDGVVGVSAGALFGVNYVSGQIGRAIRYCRKYNKDKEYMGLLPLVREGNIVSTEYAYGRVPKKLDPFDAQTFNNSDVDFFAVMTDCATGKPVYEKITDVFSQMDILRASGSMPMVSKPVAINGREYLDGGISDSIPYEWMDEQGYEKVVVVLTRDLDYVKKPFSRVLAKTTLGKYPNLAKSMLRRHQVYNDKVLKLRILEKEGKKFIIRPSEPITISKLERDEDKLQQVYELGRKDAIDRLEELKEYLK